MSDAIVIRPLNLDDAEAVAALVRRAFAAQSLVTDPPPSALRETGANIAAILAGGGGGAAAEAGTAGAGTAGAGGAMAGAVIWEEKAGGLYMGRLSVDPEFRGAGLARRLVAAAEAEALRRGLPRLWLSTRLALAGNRRLFAACGFVETAQHAHPGYDRPTFVDMEKRLT